MPKSIIIVKIGDLKMNDINSIISKRGVPDVTYGAENVRKFDNVKKSIRKILEHEMYGKIPARPDHMSVEKLHEYPIFAGNAVAYELSVICEKGKRSFSFPALEIRPITDGKLPVIVHIHSSLASDRLAPYEEIAERGYAVISVNADDVTESNGDFKSGAAAFIAGSRSTGASSGKLAIWAWSLMRIADYISGCGELDAESIAVIGHAHLGTSALIAGGFDERFKYIISNQSDCAGAALERGKVGERYDMLAKAHPYYFCPRFLESISEKKAFEFDQNHLLALSMPRYVIVGSTRDDTSTDYVSEFLALASLENASRLYGINGLVHGGRIPKEPIILDGGTLCYYLRGGVRSLSRRDFNVYMDIMDKKRRSSVISPE